MSYFILLEYFCTWKLITSATTLILCTIYVYFKYIVYGYWKRRGLFYVEPIVPFGNLLPTVLRRKYLGDIYTKQYLKHKKLGIFGMFAFHRPSLVIADPDLIRFVLIKEFSSFHDRGIYCHEEIDPLGAHLFASPGSKWKYLRAKVTPTYTSGKIKRMFDIVKDHGVEMEKIFTTNHQQDVELKEIFARFTTDVIVTTALGVSCNSLVDPHNNFRQWGHKIVEPRPLRNACIVFAPNILYALKIPFTPKDVEKFFLDSFVKTVNYRIDNNIVHQDFVDLLIQLIKRGHLDKEDEEPSNETISASDEKITIKEAAAQAFGFFIAGFETSSALSANCIYEMALNEEIQDMCRFDINNTLRKHGGKITYDSLNEMSYLHKVIQEGMRKYPALGGLPRVCTKNVVLPTGFRVEKGTDIIIPVQGIHHDPDIYPDPECFDPERFSAENVAKRHPYTYLPFGEGPRSCIGLRFGLMQTKIAIIHSLLRCRFSPCVLTPKRIKIDPGSLIAVPDCPVYVRVEII